MKTIQLYIPRLLGNVNENVICRAFDNMNVGKVTDIDMHRKVNTNGRIYYFAFLNINTYNTYSAAYLHALIDTNQPVKFVYDEEAAHYWELHKHLSRTDRLYNKIKSAQSALVPLIYNAFVEYNKPSSTECISITPNSCYNMWDDRYNLLQNV